MDLKDIKAIIDLMKKNSISEFELEKQEFKIRLKRGNLAGPATFEDAPAYAQLAAPAPGGAVAAAAAANAGDAEIKSPMIGTLYRSPSPESAPYVDVGSEVGHGSKATHRQVVGVACDVVDGACSSDAFDIDVDSFGAAHEASAALVACGCISSSGRCL